MKSLRKSEGVYGAPYDRPDDSQMNSTYDGVSTCREGGISAVSVADHTSSYNNIDQEYSAAEREVLNARKRIQLNELDTEDKLPKEHNKSENQNFVIERRLTQLKKSEILSNQVPEIPYVGEECEVFTEIQKRSDEHREEVQVEIEKINLLDRKEIMMGEYETKAVSEYEENEVLNRRNAAERESEIKMSEERRAVIEAERKEERIRVEKEKEKRMVEEKEREAENEQVREREREKERETDREREREREKDIERDRARDREREKEREVREKKEKEKRMVEEKEWEEEKEQVREREREEGIERDRARESEREREREIREMKEKEKWMVEEKEREEEKEQVNRNRERSRERERENGRRDKEEEKAKELSEKRSREEEKEQLVSRVEERVKGRGRERELEHNKESPVEYSSGKGGETTIQEVLYVPVKESKINNLDAIIRQAEVKKVNQIEKLDMNDEKKDSSEDEDGEDDDNEEEDSKKGMSFSMRSTGSKDFSSTFQSAEIQCEDGDEDDDDDEINKEDKNESESVNESDNGNENYSVVANDFDEQIVKEAVMRELKERNLRLGAQKDFKMVISKDLGSEIPRNENEDFKHDDNINYISSEWVSVVENNSEDDDVVNTKHQDRGSNPDLKSHDFDKLQDKDVRYTNKMELSNNSEVWLDQTCSVDRDKEGTIGSDMVLEQFDGLNTQELLASRTSGQEKGESRSDEEKNSSIKTQQTAVNALEQEEITKKSADDLAISEARASVILRRKLKLEKDALAASLSSLPSKGSEKPEINPVSASMPSCATTSRMMKKNTSEDSPQEDEDENENEDDVMSESKSVVGVS